MVEFYLALEKNLYQDLAVSSAAAVKEMKPNLNIWQTGSDQSSITQPIRDIMTSIPPMLQFLRQNTSGSLLDVLTNHPKKDEIKKQQL